MRLLVVLAALVLAGCGTLVPYRLAPGWLAPDVVPESPASAVTETGRSEGPGAVYGRVLDLQTGAPVAAAVRVGDREAASDADGQFDVPADGDAAVRVEAPGYRPAQATLAVGDEAVAVLVLLAREAD